LHLIGTDAARTPSGPLITPENLEQFLVGAEQVGLVTTLEAGAPRRSGEPLMPAPSRLLSKCHWLPPGLVSVPIPISIHVSRWVIGASAGL
jgi:hypothetical protein